jgi:hypothetical protein
MIGKEFGEGFIMKDPVPIEDFMRL